jgi:hypothetical protein
MADEVAKKQHWTQTPAGRKKMARVARNSHRARKKAAPTPKPETSPHGHSLPHDVVAYALGHLECWIDAFAKSAGVSPEALAARLGAVLRSNNSR